MGNRWAEGWVKYHPDEDVSPRSLFQSSVLLVVALGFDLVAEWQFRRMHRHGVARVIELDNLYIAGYWRFTRGAAGLITG